MFLLKKDCDLRLFFGFETRMKRVCLRKAIVVKDFVSVFMFLEHR